MSECPFGEHVNPCPYGCHDAIPFETANAGVELVVMLLEDWANDGKLDPFHAFPDPESGKDGLDEVVETALLLLTSEEVGP